MTRNSERKMALWEGLWEGLWKTSENLWKPLKPSLSEILPETLPRGRFPSPIVLPLETPTKNWPEDFARKVGQNNTQQEVPHRTSLAPLASPCFVVVVCALFNRGAWGGNRGLAAGYGGRGSSPLYGRIFAQSCSVPKYPRGALRKGSLTCDLNFIEEGFRTEGGAKQRPGAQNRLTSRPRIALNFCKTASLAAVLQRGQLLSSQRPVRKNSRMLWRSRRSKSRRVPEEGGRFSSSHLACRKVPKPWQG